MKKWLLLLAAAILFGYFNPLGWGPASGILAIEKEFGVASDSVGSINSVSDFASRLESLRARTTEPVLQQYLDSRIHAARAMEAIESARQTVLFSSPFTPDCSLKGKLVQAREELQSARKKITLARTLRARILSPPAGVSLTPGFLTALNALEESTFTLENQIQELCSNPLG